MIKKLILVFLCLNTILLGWILLKNGTEYIGNDCVPNEEVAIELGKTICENMYPDFDYKNYKWECLFSEYENAWLVFCSTDEACLGGGLPEVRIKRNNARVISVGLGL